MEVFFPSKNYLLTLTKGGRGFALTKVALEKV